MQIPDTMTTPFTLREDLKRSLRQRGVIVNTYGDLKYALERVFMVRDTTPIDSIEFGTMQNGSGRLVASIVDGKVEIREVPHRG